MEDYYHIAETTDELNDYLVTGRQSSAGTIGYNSVMLGTEASSFYGSIPIHATAKLSSDRMPTLGYTSFPSNSQQGIVSDNSIASSSLFNMKNVTDNFVVLDDDRLSANRITLRTNTHNCVVSNHFETSKLSKYNIQQGSDGFIGLVDNELTSNQVTYRTTDHHCLATDRYGINELSKYYTATINDGFRSIDDNYITFGRLIPGAIVNDCSVIAPNEITGTSKYHTSPVTAELNVFNDNYLTTGFAHVEKYSNLGLDYVGSSRYPLYQTDRLSINTEGIADYIFPINGLIDGNSTSFYKKLYLDNQLKFNSVGICQENVSFYSRNNSSMLSFENEVCGILSKLNSRPDHIGFEYLQSSDRPVINIYLVFTGSINGDNINIGDKITYMLTK